MRFSSLKKLRLPDAPGVYLFFGRPTCATPKASARRERGEGGRGRGSKVLYIGKATSLRDRVRSYFSRDLVSARGPLVVRMIEKASMVDFIKTDSVLEALILEAKLIRKHQPPHNVREKDDKSYNHVGITDEDFPRVLLIRGRDLARDQQAKSHKLKASYGPFPHGALLKEAMRILRKIFPFRDKCEPCIVQRNSASGLRVSAGCKPCFNRQLGLCPGVCTGEISKKDYRKIIRNLLLFLDGKKMMLIAKLKREMSAYAREREFEKASELKKTIFALEHVRDISLIKEELRTDSSNVRIEAYDIAHTSGKEMTGVMTVVENGVANKSDYRKFKIRGVAEANDTAALSEVLMRRLGHDEWPLPNIIVVDGGKAQRNAAERVLSSAKLSIPVLSVVKDEYHRPRGVEGDRALSRTHENDILLANVEAHRFAISYHKKLRGRQFKP